ncbi:MAG: hypothetical protein L6R36_003017 [Xanthoria steineri]|nr:MAG: hypothetical protein L6R36_003017 [Xanthoria steineri]
MLLLLGTILFLATNAHALPPALLSPPPPPPPPNLVTPVNNSTDAPFSTNCHGSIWCTLYAGSFIKQAYRLATEGYPPSTNPFLNPGPLNDTAFYAQGAHAICFPILGSFTDGGFCVFAQGLRGQGDRPGVRGKMVKVALARLVQRGCRMCGSFGSEEWGLVTVNYVAGSVCEGVCPEAAYRVARSVGGIGDLRGGV